MARLVVLFPAGRLPTTGGERSVLDHALHLRAKHDVVALVRPGPLTELLQREGVATVPFPTCTPVCTITAGRVVHQLARAVRANVAGDLIAQRERRAMALKVKPVTQAPEFAGAALERSSSPWPQRAWLTTDTVRVLRALALREIFDRVGAEVVIADWHDDAIAAALACHDRSTRLLWYVQNAERVAHWETWLLERADRVVAVGHDLAARRFGRLATLRVVPNGVRLERFREDSGPRPAGLEHLAPDAQLVGAVGMLSVMKGSFDLLEAFAGLHARVPAAVLLLIGHQTDAVRAQLEARTKSLGLQKAVLPLGPRKDVPALLAALDLFVHPSHTEGLSLALLEAMASGLACVASDIDGCRELLKDDVGALVPPREPALLAVAMERLLRDPEQRRSMGAAARQRVASGYLHESMLTGMAAVVDELAPSPTRSGAPQSQPAPRPS
jgi:glycosyltransferase involved in cell wall biosynthesis